MSIQSLTIAKQLAHEGLSQAQAEAIATAIVEAADQGRTDLATKFELDQMKTELLLAIEKSRNQTLLATAGILGFFVAIDRLVG